MASIVGAAAALQALHARATTIPPHYRPAYHSHLKLQPRPLGRIHRASSAANDVDGRRCTTCTSLLALSHTRAPIQAPMAPKRRPQAPAATSAASAPRPLDPRSRLLLSLLLPLSAAAFVLGVAGMAVLLGNDDNASLVPSFLAPGSPFATAWRSLLAKNAFIQPFLFNFGAIASVASAARLAEDRRAALGARGGARQQQQRKAQ